MYEPMESTDRGNPFVAQLNAGDEFIKPDLAIAYAQLAPLVAEARLHLKSGDLKSAQERLDSARLVMDLAAGFIYRMESSLLPRE